MIFTEPVSLVYPVGVTTPPADPHPARPSRRRRSGARRSALALAVVAAVLATVLTACSGGSSSARTVTVYSGRSRELIKPLLDEFAKDTGISVEFKAGDSAELAQVIATEGDRSPADVFISQTPGATGFLANGDRLAPLPQNLLDAVAAEDRSGEGEWVGLSGRVRTLVYNEDKVDEASIPAKVTDLTGPEWKGRIGIAPTNGSFQDFVSALRLELGDDATRAFLEGLAANDVRTYANNNAIVEAVGRGEVDAGLVNHYYNVRALREDPSLPSRNHFFPDGDPGSLLIVSSAGILRTAPHRAEAEELVRYLLSEKAQRYFAENTDEYPLAAGVQPSAELPPLASLDADRVAYDQLGADLESTITMIKDAGLSR